MKAFKKKYNRLYIIALLFGLFSCTDYLDIVPPEQAALPDAVRNHDATLKFLYSCYGGVTNPMHYSVTEASSDEWVLPPLWREQMHNVLYGLITTGNVGDNRWHKYYTYIGQCYLFLNQLPQAKELTEEERREYEAEANFMIAYYHMEILKLYGPCPVIEGYLPTSTPDTQFPGRSHFDYVTNWIVKKFDEVAEVLPATRSDEKWGRATSVMAKALKARLLVYAASPLWNGEFPFPDWRNKNYETPGFGKELVSVTRDNGKWERAKIACQEAITAATTAGHALYTDEELYSREGIDLANVYVPGLGNDAAANNFRKKVLLMRYLVATRKPEGNNEIIWGLANQGNMIIGSLPHYINFRTSNNSNYGGYSGVSPILNTSIQYFYTKNGKRPAKDNDFVQESEWYKSAGLANGSRRRTDQNPNITQTLVRSNIINLNVNREPRFYAWFAFDGGDYGAILDAGYPLHIELRNPDKQGYNPNRFNRDNNVTGYFSQKFMNPKYTYNRQGSTANGESKPRPLIRMAELFLNLAECHAALGETQEAITELNKIRTRAGVPALTTADVTSDFTITDWVRNERFIELWGEGHRYYDIRRWVIAPETMGSDKRLGLNSYGIKAPSFEQFNTVKPVEQQFIWHNRMYLYPVHKHETYKDPQLVQAPGY